MPNEDKQEQPPQDVSSPSRYEGIAPYDPTVERAARDEQVPLLSETGEVLPRFDKRFANDLDGLLFLGSLSETFSWLGHRFTIRTLTQGELLLVPLLMKEWAGTIGEAKSYATALVSLCIIDVDGQPLPLPIEETRDPNAWAWQRFNYVRANWFQYAIDQVYNRYIALETKVQEVIDAMEKASGPTGSTGGSKPGSDGPNDSNS